MRPSNKGNGMTYDQELNLLVCEHSTSSVARFRPDGAREVMCSHFEGKELNSPNDICVKSDGSIYFTDPTYGRMEHFGCRVPATGLPGCLPDAPWASARGRTCIGLRSLHVQPAQWPVLLAGRAADVYQRYRSGQYPGLRCRRRRAARQWPDFRLRHPRQPESRPAGRHEMRHPGQYLGDGARRRLGLCAGGILLGKLEVPEMVANLHWGGDDWTTLFMFSTTSLYSVQTKVRPHNEPFMHPKTAGSGARSSASTGASGATTSEPAPAASTADGARRRS